MDATTPLRIGCLECDLLVAVEPLVPGQRADCPRCGNLLTSNGVDAFTRAMAFAIAAAVLFAMSLSFPFLSMSASGFHHTMSLPSGLRQIWEGGYPEIAVLVALPIMIVPSVMLAALMALLLLLQLERRTHWLVPLARALSVLEPWAMVEVFTIGVIVSLVKIGAMAKVVLGLAFWSYSAFALCFIAAFVLVDRVQLWDRIEELAP